MSKNSQGQIFALPRRSARQDYAIVDIVVSITRFSNEIELGNFAEVTVAGGRKLPGSFCFDNSMISPREGFGLFIQQLIVMS